MPLEDSESSDDGVMGGSSNANNDGSSLRGEEGELSKEEELSRRGERKVKGDGGRSAGVGGKSKAGGGVREGGTAPRSREDEG